MHFPLLIILALLQSLLLCGGQVFMKIALSHMQKVAWSWNFILHSLILNWWWLACGVCFTAAGLMWMYIIKHYPFSQAYPLSSITYIFGMLAAMFIFHEHINLLQWLGVLLIMTGCFLVAR